MRRSIRYTALLTAGVTDIGLALTGLAPSASAATGEFQPAPINWQACQEAPTDPALRCATIQLPIDWAHPDGPTFGMAIAERKATDPAEDRGPLVVNPGGPGASGVDFVVDAASEFSANLMQHFDLIGFDSRGTDRSDPIECSYDLLVNRPALAPANEAQFTALLAFNHRLADDCRAHTGAIYDHVDTASVARDLDALRAALGVSQISYYGSSYASLLGEVYSEMFPDRVRALVLDSTMDHNADTTGLLVGEAASQEASFGQFVDWCDRDSTCALHGQDVVAIWDNLMHRADDGTLTVPDAAQTHEPGPVWLQLSADAFFYTGQWYWSDFAKLIAQLNASPPTSTASAPSPTAATPTVGRFAVPVVCQDWSFQVHDYQQLQQYLAESKQVAPHVRIGSNQWGGMATCIGSGDPVNDPQRPLHVRTKLPILVLNSLYDPATPYSWAVDNAAQLGQHGRLVTYLGWGHIAYSRTSCTTGTVDNYLINLTLPRPGMTCAAAPPPDNPS